MRNRTHCFPQTVIPLSGLPNKRVQEQGKDDRNLYQPVQEKTEVVLGTDREVPRSPGMSARQHADTFPVITVAGKSALVE